MTTESKKDFLDVFAKDVDLDHVMSVTKPSALLVEAHALSARIEDEGAQLLVRSKNGAERPLPARVLNNLLLSLEKVYEIDDDLDLIDVAGRIKRNKRSLTIWADTLRRKFVRESGKIETLQAYISRLEMYSISFHDARFMYFMGRCFEDSAGKAEIDSLLSMLVPQPAFIPVTSEKGDVLTASTAFDTTSLFSTVEQLAATDDYVFCDDLGDEWADHITLNSAEACIAFIHSKHGAESNSASNLHDVVSQGIKNLGNMFFDGEQLSTKYKSKWSNKYSGTKIDRRRKGDARALKRTADAMTSNYRLHRKCILACTFLSKRAVSRDFEKIKRGEKVRGNISQMFWIISSFAHAAKDMSVIPIIYCRP
jgi:hypothetical protein